MYATEVEFPDDKCRMQYVSCVGHEGYWNDRHSLCVIQRAVQQQMEIMSGALSMKKYILMH